MRNPKSPNKLIATGVALTAAAASFVVGRATSPDSSSVPRAVRHNVDFALPHYARPGTGGIVIGETTPTTMPEIQAPVPEAAVAAARQRPPRPPRTTTTTLPEGDFRPEDVADIAREIVEPTTTTTFVPPPTTAPENPGEEPGEEEPGEDTPESNALEAFFDPTNPNRYYIEGDIFVGAGFAESGDVFIDLATNPLLYFDSETETAVIGFYNPVKPNQMELLTYPERGAWLTIFDTDADTNPGVNILPLAPGAITADNSGGFQIPGGNVVAGLRSIPDSSTALPTDYYQAIFDSNNIPSANHIVLNNSGGY